MGARSLALTLLTPFVLPAMARASEPPWLWTLETKLHVPGDEGINDVAIGGDTIVVGSRGDDHAGALSGSARVWVGAGAAWTEQAWLTASDAAPSDNFGEAVAISGDTVLVGAPAADSGGGARGGAAYVFVRAGTVWSQEAKLTASDAAFADLFGSSVDLDGDTAVIGAYGDDAGAWSETGAAYVFERSGTAWSQAAKLVAPTKGPADWLGWSVAVSGDVAAVGAHWDDHAAGVDAGSVHVFARSGTSWSHEAMLVAADAAAGDWFGWALSADGDSILVGARQDTNASGFGAGAGYVFTRAGTAWSQTGHLLPKAPATNDSAGHAVVLRGDVAAVSALDDDEGGFGSTGAVSLFHRDAGGGWNRVARIVDDEPGQSEHFGDALGLAGSALVVGAFRDEAPVGFGSASVLGIEPCPAPVGYCTAGATTNGCTATLDGVGFASASASSGFDLVVSGAEGQRSGLLFYGVNGRAALPWGMGASASSSWLCVKGPTQRTPVGTTTGTAGACDGGFALDWNAYRHTHPTAQGAPFAAGDTANAQFWFRDPPSPNATHLSNGLEFTVCP